MDENVVQIAWESHREQLLGYMRSLTHDAEAAEDVVQEAFARLACEADAGRAPRNVRAWLFQVARNVHTSDGRRRRTAERYSVAWPPAERAASAEEEALLAEQRQSVRSLLEMLPPDDRTSLVMTALGYSGSEVSRVIGCREGALRTRMCRLRARLRVEWPRC